jgi:CheY-like chemotaxis protein
MPDVILLDWNMPVMEGIDFLRVLRTEKGGEAPIVVFCTTCSDISTTLALWKRAERSACGSAGNDKEPQAERTAWR